MTTTSERATATVTLPTSAKIAQVGIGHNKPPVQRVCCPNCSASFDAAKSGKPRSPEQHRRFWALMTAGFHHWPEGHDEQFASVDEFRHWITMKAGWRDLQSKSAVTGLKPDLLVAYVQGALKASGSHSRASIHKGQLVIWSPRSIRFDKMRHLEFCALNNAVEEIIKAEIGVTGDELIEQHGKAA